MKFCVITSLMGLIGVIICSCQSDDKIEFKRYYLAGQTLYQQKCQNCHGSNGEGLGALIPPLTDTVYLNNNKTRLACIIKIGMVGKTIVNGKNYEGNMPGNDLAPIEIAKLVTYITNSFGSKLGISNAQQAEADLANCR